MLLAFLAFELAAILAANSRREVVSGQPMCGSYTHDANSIVKSM
jgi:hypothetical protein